MSERCPKWFMGNEMLKIKVYFAHPMELYGTAEEAELLKRIEKFCCDADSDLEVEIVNPADLQNEFETWKKDNAGKEHDMRFFKRIVRGCDAVFYFGDSPGVAYEVKKAREAEIPTFDLTSID